MGSKAYTRREAADALGVGVRTVDNYIKRGFLKATTVPTVGLHRGVRISRAEIEKFRARFLGGAK